MHIPEELICLILAQLYYRRPPLNKPDYSTLSACSLVNSHWRIPSQTLLFRRITLEATPEFARFAETTSNLVLLSHVRSISITLPPVSTLVSLLGRCPQIYDLGISASALFSMDSKQISSLSAVIRDRSISIRSLRLMECSVQSPILYELIALFPSVEFLTLGVEVAALPPLWTPAIQLYELTLQRTLSSDVLAWLLSASGTSLRVLELRDLPSAHTASDLATCCPHIQSLRLMRYNARSAAILRQCNNLLELVLMNVPLVDLPQLPSSLEHFALLIQTYTTSVDLRLVIAAVDALPHLRILSFVGGSQDLPLLRASCDTKGVTLQSTLAKLWINDDPVKTTRFPRRQSVSNFYLMN
ncbi:hypothetical protein B0H19DRAFT_1249894 [Mycena capillaripes]|nr:hypothetical protein B0H19DRAFT_1249894 [Mycena capillaripes]